MLLLTVTSLYSPISIMASPELALVTVLSLLFLGQVSFAETVNEQIKVCQTFGSGVVEPFRGIPFHLSTTCPTTLLHFIHKDVEYKIIITHSLKTGLIKKVEFILNKLITVVTDGMITVEDKSVSLPYDHMYKHIHPYGIYTKLKSKILELSVIWRFAGSEIDYLWVELSESNIEEKDALCWQGGTSENVDISPSRFIYKTEECQTRTSITLGMSCKFLSHFYGCFIENDDIPNPFQKYSSLCKANIYYYENTKTLECAFYSAIKRYCDMETYEPGWKASKCPKPTCPGDLIYMEQGNPFTPTCSHPNFINSENTVETCVCPAGKVLNNFENSSRCIPKEECPCVYGGKIFAQGENRMTKCQSCTCENGAWTCIKENCQKRCIIEGGSVTTYDGKQYMLPKACTYVASQGLNWTIIIELSEDLFLGKVILQIEQKTYTFSKDSVKFENEEILELHLTEHVMVFWQSSMYVQVQTSFGMKIQVQVKPKVQLYVTLPKSESGKVKGLCGNHNDDTRDDFIGRSEIRESVAEYFALSWVMGTCNSKTPGICNSDVDKYAHQDCSYLMDPSGIFASCHNEVPSEDYVKACEKIVCNCEGNKDCLCVALGNYAKACLNQGIDVGDWRNTTSCVEPCNSGQMFSYDARSCNSTCQSLAGPDPACDVHDAPVEGCGCPHGSLLNSDGTCTTRSECQCYYLGKTLKPGNHFIGKTKCNCKDGKLDCPEPLGCSHGKTYVNCYNSSINTVNRKCASLGMPEIMSTICESGCYCPDGQYEDHNGTCVAPADCPCLFSGVAYKSGETVTYDCQACTCKGGLWACVEEACSGNCEVFGNGHYKTFDSKWYNFDGNCEYTLVEDDCGSGHRTFSIRAESVPCCEERLTCSRRITLELQGKDTLNLHDLEVGQIGNDTQLLYSVHTVGLYFEIRIPSLDITLTWDKHTRLIITLGKRWKNKVCGLCGNFNNNEQDDLQIRGSKEKTDALTSGNSWKMPVPQCSDATEVQFNCVHFSYCANWAERRCKIISSDIFTACHQKVDYIPYYKACVEESCSCSADQASHGFCTAVAAFAEACCEAGVTVNWRTPERCPIYCDYYNEQNPQSSDATWHYKSCGPLDIKICGKNYISRKLEGCYPTCPEDFPYFDENTKKCSKTCTTTTVSPTTTTESTTTVTEPPTTTTESTTVSPTTVTESTATPTVTPTIATTITTIRSTITPTITSTPSTESTTTVTEPPTTTTESTTVSPTTVTESTATPTVTPTTATTITTVGSTITPTITSTPSTESTTTVTEPPTTTTGSTTVSPTTVTESTATPTVTPTTATTITTVGSTITPTITSTPSTESTTTVTEPPTTTTESTTVSPTTVTESTATPTVTPTTATTITTIGSTITPTITSTPSTESTTAVTEPPTTTTGSTTVSPTTVTESTATPTVSPTTATTVTTIRSTITPTITSTESTESTTTVTEPPTTTTESTTVSPTTVTESTATPTVTPITATTITTVGSTITPTITSTPSTESTTTVTEPPTTKTESTTVSPTTVTETTATPTVTPTTATTITTIGSTITPTITSTPSTESTTTVTEPPTTTTGSTTVSPTTVTESTATPTVTPTTATTITTVGSTITPTITSTPSTESTTTVTQPPTTTTESTTVSPTTVTESTATPTVTPTTATTITTIGSTITPTITSTPSTESTTTVTEPPTTTTGSTTVSPTTVTESTATPTVSPTTATTITTVGSTITPTITSTPSTESTTTVTEPPTTTTESTTVSPTTVTESTTTPTVTSASTTESTTVSPTTVTESTTTPTVTPTTATTVTTIVSTITPTITSTTTESATTTVVCFCRDEKNLRNWSCGQTWTENCIQYACNNRTIFQDKVSCPPEVKPDCPNGKLTSVPTDDCCQTWKCVYCSCWDETKLRNRTCGQTWTENCIQYTCNNGTIFQNKVSCSPEVTPDCPNGKMRSVRTDDCCQTWECDCQCQVYGDPHYITFDGTPYDFLEDCSYILVEEKKQKHNFSVIVDNFNCVANASCVRAVRVQYGKNIITLSIVSNRLIVSEFNNVNVPQPYENQGIRITTTNWKVSIYIDAIRSYVSLTPRRVLVVNLAMAYFHGNTQGQCGECGGGACVRRNGDVEPDTCCDKTAYSWLYEEKEKPHCKVKDVSCNTTITVPQCYSKRVPLCELFNHKAFKECSKKVDLTLLKKNCLFDSCMAKNNSIDCEVLEKAASDCQNAGFCVDWRPLTNGSCDVKCPEGMIYKECPSTPTTICEGGRISTKIMDTPTAGCFCPGNKHRAGGYTHTCVSDCTDCVGPHGEPKEPGDVWEANCYLCTCDKITLTQRCEPKTRSSLPTCQDNETLVRFNSTGCCNMAVCVEKTCEHRGHTYKIGERWSDSAQPCVLYSCEISGITIENKLCAEEQCLEGSRVCDKQKGCYTCKNTCSPRMSRVNVTIDGKCTDEVELPVCEGQCTSHSRWNDSELRMEKECQCCQEKTSQEKSITLKCKGGSKNTFTYKHIVDCECQLCH
ncbi:mucin-2-like isoform X8 [Anguilla anguilla]|uniref:mucin-2-like isoform X8 n=1 Tax=Anguilla anguilla TaxID=7936 RepID=UPI0015AC8862|nr:mucin-2-like isoform X8 [Anguilla anguilla]